MNRSQMEQESGSFFPHEEENRFRDAIQFTAAQTEFPPALIEKDYFCSLILRAIYMSDKHSLIFKGGTSLNKVHSGFYRLSEDLDFSISIASDVSRAERSRAVAPVKTLLSGIIKSMPGVTIREPLKGSNGSTQYNAEIEYTSFVSPMSGAIRFEIGLREEIIGTSPFAFAQTLILDPFKNQPLITPFNVRTLDIQEAYAEKVRAAFSRNVPAIRDLFDLDFAMRENKINFLDRGFQKLVMQKLSVPGNGPVKFDDGRKTQLLTQVETELRPVLRSKDFEQFEFDTAWRKLVVMYERMGISVSK